MKQAIDKKPSEKPSEPPAKARPEIIVIRKTCDAEGTGLSHYVLTDKGVKR